MELTDDDLLNGDVEAIRQKIDQVVEEKVKAAGELPAERQVGMETAKKEFAIFADDDEEVREIAGEMLTRVIRSLPDNATTEDYRKAAEGVSKKLARLHVEQEQKAGVIPSPVPTGGGSAAASHASLSIPQNVEEAERLADKIASDFQFK